MDKHLGRKPFEMADEELQTYIDDRRADVEAEEQEETLGGDPGFATVRRHQLDEALRAAHVRGLETW